MTHQLYNPISHHYHEVFGTRVQKIPVTIASDCPNRRGLKGMQTCIFCDEHGSAAYPDQNGLDLSRQIQDTKVKLKKRFNRNTFVAYFQAYTSTFMGTRQLQEQFDTALQDPEIKGLVIGTRPDCLSDAVMKLWKEYSEKTYLAVEFGVQSFNDDHLVFVRRGHDVKTSLDAIKKTKLMTNARIGIHLIFGMPGETDEEVIEAARMANSLPINDVKLHNLHVLKNTPLEDLYHQGRFSPLDLETYSHRVILFLQHLRPEIFVHRLAAVAARSDELVAPKWTALRMANFQFILDEMRKRGAYQGQLQLINDARQDRVRDRESVLLQSPV